MDCFDTSRFAIKRGFVRPEGFRSNFSLLYRFCSFLMFFIFLWMREGTVSRTFFITAWCCRDGPVPSRAIQFQP